MICEHWDDLPEYLHEQWGFGERRVCGNCKASWFPPEITVCPECGSAVADVNAASNSTVKDGDDGNVPASPAEPASATASEVTP